MNRRCLEVCICTTDFIGPIRNGGIGTAYHALARALVEAGHHVTVLFALGNHSEQGSIDDWIAHYRAAGITFVPLPPCELPVHADPHVRMSYDCYSWLTTQEAAGRIFDVIHFHEWRGIGFYSALAKRQGSNFSQSVICVGTHSPHLWHLTGMKQHPRSLHDLQADWLERGSVRWADCVVSPSRYMLDWIKSQGWTLPAETEVIQYVLPQFRATEEIRAAEVHSVNKIVFFGRLETRKGITLFCDALDQLVKQTDLPPFEVVFLGKRSEVDRIPAGDYLARRAEAWSFKWSIVDGLDSAGAMAFLREGNRFAVMPSLVENLPQTVLECLGNGIPFLCSDLPGNRELVAGQDGQRVTFALRPRDLAMKLRGALVDGIKPAQPAIRPEQTKAAWIAWHEQIAGRLPGPNPPADQPFVSVCLTHFNRPAKLAQAIESIRRQDYQNFELVLVDDGSTQPEALEYLASISDEFELRSWQLIRQPNRYLGAARNAAIAAARGKWLMFMDDDNYAMPDEVSTFVRAAICSGADVLTCAPSFFHGDDVPGPQTPRAIAPPLGGAAVLGMFANCFGDANGFFRREVLERIGGYTEDYGVGFEDCEAYAKAVLAGFNVLPVPRSLYWYRVDSNSMVRTTDPYANNVRMLRPYEQRLPQELRHLPLLIQGFYFDHAAAGPRPQAPDLAGMEKQFWETVTEHLHRLKEVQNLETAYWDAAKRIEQNPTDAQYLVDEYWDSRSWRLALLIRAAMAKLLGRPAPKRPTVTTVAEAQFVVEQIRRSASWEITGPLRAVAGALAVSKHNGNKNGNGHSAHK